MGIYYQIENDFLDCFDETDLLKKPGSDIEEGKCSWPIVMAMNHGSDEQIAILKKCYGKRGEMSICATSFN